jgi:hypothetical protein
VWSLFFGVAAVLLLSAIPAHAAGIVTSNMLLQLDAANADGAGGAGHLGSGTNWSNLASATGSTYDGTLLTTTGHNGIMPAWGGSGTPADPYCLQFRIPTPSGNRDTGFVAVNNTYTTGNALDTTTYTYEVWVKNYGPGNGHDAVDFGEGNLGALISHNTNAAGQGMGVLYYSGSGGGGLYNTPVNGMFYQGGAENGDPLPNSTGVATLTGYHQVVFTRDGSLASDNSSFYLDGVLQGTLQTDSGPAVDSFLTIGCCSWGALSANNCIAGLNSDIGVVRVYGAALTGAEVAQNYAADIGRFPAVPEPSTLVLLTSGLIGLVCYAWRKRK